MCGSEHYFFTNNPLEWDEFIKDDLGEDVYEELRRLALAPAKYKHRHELEALLEEMK